MSDSENDGSLCCSCIGAHRRHKASRNRTDFLVDKNVKKKLLTDDVPQSTMRCTDRDENQTDKTKKAKEMDKKQKMSEDHEIDPMNKEMKLPSKSDEGAIFCDSCNADNDNENDNVPIATMFCMNCEEINCCGCTTAHTKQKLSKDHKVAPIDEEMTRRLNKDKGFSKSDKHATVCDSGNADKHSENDEVPKAVMFCPNCEESCCDGCSKVHKGQTLSTDHTVVPIDGKTKKQPADTNRCTETTREKMSASLSSTDSDIKLVKLKILIDNEVRDLLKDDSFSKIRHMLVRPTIKDTDLENFLRIALPYIIQRIKTWNGYVLSAQSIASMVVRTQKKKNVANLRSATIQEKINYPVSRLDCIAYIINAADSIVARDILRIMSKFPMSMPLVIPDMRENGKYIVILPALQNIIVKWESTPGEITENHLFSSPYRMICAIRLGTNKIGKSTILNQLMRKQYMFSSIGEPGSGYGRPLTLDGTVEIVWLTQETCSDTTWNTTVCNHYKRKTEEKCDHCKLNTEEVCDHCNRNTEEVCDHCNRNTKEACDHYKPNINEVAILANLHGDALQHRDTLKYLEHLACSFIVFQMPNSTDSEFHQLKEFLSCQNFVPVLVDPIENLDEASNIETIYTDSLAMDDTQETVRSVLQLSLSFHLSTVSTRTLGKSKSLRYAESLHCKKSEEILDIVRRQGCFSIKQLLLNFDLKQNAKWTESLTRLVRFSLAIFNLQPSDAKKSLTYLENQLSQLSANESVTARAQVSDANEKLRRIVKAPKKSTAADGDFQENQYQAYIKKAQEELTCAMDKVDNINLGQEHLFRALGQMYEKSFDKEIRDFDDFSSIRDLPDRLATLLISGHAIEMLNGDSGEIPIVWIKAICEKVSKQLPNLKIFVMSIIGLQSSGKSTLLNALFSCRFAVSVGRCSRGLFMRMILMDEPLRKTYGCDAFILIDTEGLGSPEKMNDPKASQKDRLMATFAMGVSNLTIVNILGEGMTEMTEVLQIAIVAMARLRGGGIKPDILLVQHLQERNLSKIDQAKGQFCEAINKAFELISKNDVEIGSASKECLDELTARIQSGDIFKNFGAFKDGSSVNSPPSETYHEDVVSLFETLLKRTQALGQKSTFERWSNHFESYWRCVREENFALNFKNVKHITDFLYFEKKVAKVKELNDGCLRYHRELCANEIRQKINIMIESKQKIRTDSMRKDLLQQMKQKLLVIPHQCPDKCGACEEFISHYTSLFLEIDSTEWGPETKHSLKQYNDKLHETTTMVLMQTFDGSVVKQGCFSEFSDLITKKLNQALERRPTGKFETEEQNVIVNDIWGSLQNIAAPDKSAPDLQTRMNQALLQTYVNTGIFPNIFQDFSIDITDKYLIKKKAVKSRVTEIVGIGLIGRLLKYDKLTKDQISNLTSHLEQLVITVLHSRHEDYFKSGLDFDEGMVSEIKTNFPTKIKEYEEKFDITLHDEFKMSLQVYTLQQLMKRMTNLQTLWNRQNKPNEILLQKKDDYINEIQTRLKYGFSCAGEGKIVAEKLCKSIKLNAIKAGYDAHIQAVKNAAWTENSEKVRLQYFLQLANEVADVPSNRLRALAHFANPKSSIELWFAKEVNLLKYKKSVPKTYRSTLNHELNRVKKLILNSDSNKDIDKIVKEQFKSADDQYYSQLDPKDDDFDAFKSSIVRTLESFVDSKDSKQAKFDLPSSDPVIKNLLGCCEHCFWCGALCWGSRHHKVGKNNDRTMEAHHACHQPNGLKGTNYLITDKLSGVSCHNMKDEHRVYFDELQEDEGMLWSDAKQNHFKDWKFDAHWNTKFDELMRWFFQQLHEDIAASEKLSPADDDELKENGCTDLKLDEILKVVCSKI